MNNLESSPLLSSSESIEDSPTLDNHEEPETRTEDIQSRMVGAGLVAGIVTLPLGPIIAIASGIGASIGTKDPGLTGDICRGLGDVAVTASERARQINEKHHFVEVAKAVVDKCWRKIMEFEAEHHLVENSVKGIGQFFLFVGDKINLNKNNNQSSTPYS
mmetsp:Transcript_16084/g.22906  ORF Transcript_16084/g.22906 Transcript_16084/m.22906 type:complete len:160 (-) Transcript_16084:338-817(-)|eukprot:CAMPEP_0184871284 /NCGR_PEP_ID=MMETSP0580-20130426/40607_1 /TAXON_ID=1118495 /ORGANISM="Dactyliosolen fragilissimus" /LENGTH=159 /DNA_ID=CAMNT_0027373917 /DNA_START=215 /DNA_END=694 /DNA_ORIENTATION=-